MTKEISTIDLIYFISGPPTSLLSSMLLFISAYVFLKKDFKDRPIFNYISINTAIDGLRQFLSATHPIILYYSTQKTPLPISYFLEFFSYYVIICISITLKAISEHLSITIAVYRIIELSRFRQFNNRLNFKFVIIFLFILSILTTFPVYTWSKIGLAENGTMYQRQANELYFYGFNFIQTTIKMRQILNFTNFFIILILNIKLLIALRSLYKTRDRILKMSLSNSRRLLSNSSQESDTCYRELKTTSNELHVSLLVGSFLAVAFVDVFLKLVFQYTTFINTINDVHGYIFIHYCYFLLDTSFFCCYFSFSSDFRKNLKNIID